jgi:hypothetical protein
MCLAKSVAAQDSEYTGRCMVHLDAFSWVQRDSYLPQGNQVRKTNLTCRSFTGVFVLGTQGSYEGQAGLRSRRS